MEALVFDIASKTLSFRDDVKVPVVTSPDDVVISVHYCGVCGTDLHILDGFWTQFCDQEAFVPGHEFSGIIHAVGSGVTNLQAGDKVAVNPNNYCKTCEFCVRGKTHFCTTPGNIPGLGVSKDGAFAEFIKVPKELVYKLPANLPLKQDLGVRVGTPAEVSEWFHSRGDLNTCGADLVIDCSGIPAAMEAAIPWLKRGGAFCAFAISPEGEIMMLEPFLLFEKELRLFGVHINHFTYPLVIPLVTDMAHKYLDFEKLGIKEFELKQYASALQSLRNGESSKAVFKITRE